MSTLVRRSVKGTALTSAEEENNNAITVPFTDSKTANYTVLTTDEGKLLLCDATSGAFTVTLPTVASAGDGFAVHFKKTDSSINAVTIDGNGAETIDGNATYSINNQYDSLTVVCTGTAWVVKTYSQDSLLTSAAADTGWRDLIGPVTGAATGGGTPTATVFGPSGNIKQTAFGVNDSVYMSFHVQHDTKPGSTMYPHVHWSTNGTSTASVKWEINYTTAAGHNQAAFPAESTITVEEAASGTAWQHMVTEDATGITAPEVDSLILIELKRITNGGTENLDTVFGLTVDWHYEVDRLATKNRAPDFYT